MTKTIFIFCVLLILLFVTSCSTHQPSVHQDDKTDMLFEWIKNDRIATDGGQSRGVAWGDYNADGLPDLYVSNAGGQWNALYKNRGNGTFQKITDSGVNKMAEAVIHGGNSQGVNWVDYDNDGDLDLYVVSREDQSNFLFRNDQVTAFTQITDSPITANDISASVACWADIEGDGDLDVFLAGYNADNLLFRNLGAGRFEKVEDTGLTNPKEGNSRACACGDANNDGLPEFYVANPRRPNDYYLNMGNWKFEKVTRGHVVTDIGYSYGVSWADYDDDGDLDLFVANFDKENVLYNNDGQGNLMPITSGIIVEEQEGASKGHTWGDYDNDGDLDLFVANGTYSPNMQNFLYLNRGDGSFVSYDHGDIVTHADTSAGAAHADIDRDGDLDLFVANWGASDEVNRFYRNKTTGKNWVSFRLIGTTSNSFGIGAKLEIFTKVNNKMKRQFRWMYPVTGYGSQNDYELHFGLARSQQIDSIRIYWPSNSTDIHKNLVVNTHWVATENGALVAGK